MGTALSVGQGQWLGALTTAAIPLVTLLPVVLGRRLRVFIPPELEALAVIFVFAVALGAIREIFEFAMNGWFGLNMRKSGLVDAMWDLIVDAVGAGVIAALGYGWLRTAGNESFLERWIEGFVVANPRLFGETGRYANRQGP